MPSSVDADPLTSPAPTSPDYLSPEYVDLQVRFAERVAEAAALPLDDALLRYTNFHRRLGLGVPDQAALPEQWRETADALIRKHANLGWSDINIGLPDYSNSPQPNVFVYATPPSGERVSCIVTQDEAGFLAIDKFLTARISN